MITSLVHGMHAFSCWDICPAWPTQSPRRRRADVMGAKSSAMKHKMIAACANRHCRDESHSLNIERSAATTTTRCHRNYNIIFGTEYKCSPLVNGVLSHCSLAHSALHTPLSSGSFAAATHRPRATSCLRALRHTIWTITQLCRQQARRVRTRKNKRLPWSASGKRCYAFRFVLLLQPSPFCVGCWLY